MEHINEFRKFLLSIRQAYLQTAPNRSQARSTNTLTGKERDEIDFEAKSIIRQTMTRIQVLETLEKGTSPSARTLPYSFCDNADRVRAQAKEREEGISGTNDEV